MFNKVLNQLTLANGTANEVLGRIEGDYYQEDQSFLATLRALLASRLAPEDNLCMRSCRINFATGEMNGEPIHQIIRYTCGRPLRNKYLYIISVDSRSGKEGNDIVFSKLDSDFMHSYNNFERVADLEQFALAHKQLRARFYINKEMRITLVFAESINMRIFHFLQSLIPRYIPWHFEEKPINDQEKALLASCLSRYAVDYERIIAEIAEQFDFRKYRITSMLNDFEKRGLQSQLAAVKDNIDSLRDSIARNIAQYMSFIEQSNQLSQREAGLISQINSNDGGGELLDYFLCNKNLELVAVEGNIFSFIVDGFIENFDPEMYETLAKNRHSHLYQNYRRSGLFRENSNVKLFLDAIFSDEPLLRIKTCAYYRLDTRGIADSRRGYIYPDVYMNHLPNPHLQIHDCLGNHKRYIEEALRTGNIIGAIAQCISSAKSVNIGESPTVCTYFEWLMNDCRKTCIVLPDNTEVTPLNALKWLKEQNNVQKEETKEE